MVIYKKTDKRDYKWLQATTSQAKNDYNCD